MSLYVDGVLASSVGFSAVPRSSISHAFISRLPHCFPPNFGVTFVAGPYASLSTVLQCKISPIDSTDFVLGLDWVSMVHEHLLRNGYRLDDSFDPWAFFTQAGRSAAGLPLSTPFCLSTPRHPLRSQDPAPINFASGVFSPRLTLPCFPPPPFIRLLTVYVFASLLPLLFTDKL
ncbi:hypothetical protein C8F04DRAFT_1262250 [Mycena alexandri]|uniref:Uncharacterized protein n=1 Tax=Mycena alexandri TaxID=1745969 RepID=A0AAD6SR28_9AGAR|nr:hypothetical protein C8F04DRAFT_1262250 [Mycena alexandri]